MPTDGITLANQLYLRMDQRLTPEQCIPFLNHGLANLGSVASWIWDQVSNVGAVPVANIVSIPTLHMGKKISAFNANLLPIGRVEQNDMASSAAGYINTSTTIYSTFRLGVNGTSPFIEFFPALLVMPSVDLYYHQVPPTLTIANPAVTVRWTVPEMDDLLLDMAEQEARRVYRMQRDPQDMMEIAARLKLFSGMFTTERINTGPVTEAADSKAESDQVGRT